MMEELKSAPRPADATAVEPARAKPRRVPPKRPGFSALREGTDGARRLCAVILEVLAGVRTPTDAAGVIGVSLPRYYGLEAQALLGLLKACERRARGPRRSPERECERLRRECQRLERESARHQALLRAQGRTVGIPPVAKAKTKPEGKKRRRRRPAVRALRAAKALSTNPAASAGKEETRSSSP